MKKKTRLLAMFLAIVLIVGMLPLSVSAANPFLPMWERVPDGEPRIFTDPKTGEERLYIYGSHDSRLSGYCGPDHVVWSAPLDDPNNWRHEGEAFHVDQLNGVDYVDRDGVTKQLIVDVDANLRVMLYAPDVVYHPENNKYYMYIFVDGMWHTNPDPPAGLNRRRHPMFVVSSDSPAGPFTDPKFVHLAFDPAVLVDDVKNEDGKSRVYLYWTPEENRNLHAVELDPNDMATILPDTEHYPLLETEQEPKNTMPDWVAPFHMFEGASMRKVNGMYILSYCRADRPTQTSTSGISEIGWAYSDNPYGDPALGTPWTYGGVVVDNRGEQVANPYTGETTYTFSGGNIHGGMVDLNGQWYQIFHRSTNISSKRQAMAEPFDLRFVDGIPVIDQVELTSQGFETNGLDPFKEQYAGIACYVLPATGNTAPQFFSQNNDANINFDPNAERDDWYPVQNIRNRSWVGYKYFNFGEGVENSEQIKLKLTLRELAAGTINIYAADAKAKFTDPEQPKTLIGSITLEGIETDRHTVEGLVNAEGLTGKKGIYLEFLNENIAANASICEVNKLQFVKNESIEAGWVKDATGWKYQLENGTLLTSAWKKTGGLWYYLGAEGYLKTGWVQDEGQWYFLDRNTGAMKSGWIKDGKWYYLGADGAMATGWLQDGEDRYFLDKTNGNMKTGWVEDGEDWYFMEYDTGIMATDTFIGGYWVGADGKWDPNHQR